MKRILTVFSAVICLILSLCVPVASFAVDESGYVNPDRIYTLEQFQYDYTYTNQLYFYFNHFRLSDSGPKYDVGYNYYLQCSDDVLSSCSEDNGVYSVSFSKELTLYRKYGDYSGFETYSFSVRSFKFNSNDETITFYAGSDFTSIVWLPGFETYSQFYTNIWDAVGSLIPDVTVEFIPDLSGKVDRTILSSSGSKSLLQELNMKVTNNSPFAIQYRMWIEKKDQITSRTTHGDLNGDYKAFYETSYDDDPVFVYYSNAVVYDVIGENSAQEDFNVQDVTKYNKSTDWHYLTSGQVDDVTFDFSMINMTENCSYVCKVWAYKCDYECASTRLYNPDSEGFPAAPEFKQVDMTNFLEAYNSTFVMLQYSDIKYDPNKKSDKVLPYDGSKGISSAQQYKYSYDAKVDKNTGEQLIGHKDLYNDANSWINKDYSFSSGSSGSMNFSDISVSSFSGMFSRVFGCVNMFMNYLPPSIMNVFVFGFSCIVVIAIIKAVR